MYKPDNYLFCLLANCFLFFRSDLAVFIFPMLLADIQRKDPIKSRLRVPTQLIYIYLTYKKLYGDTENVMCVVIKIRLFRGFLSHFFPHPSF